MNVHRGLALLLFCGVARRAVGRCGADCRAHYAELAKRHPPPPPPMDSWQVRYVAEQAKKAGLNDSVVIEQDIDGSALHEMWIQHQSTMAKDTPAPIPKSEQSSVPASLVAVLDASSDKSGPKLRFLHMVRRWASAAARPGPPPPPTPSFPPPPPLPEPPTPDSPPTAQVVAAAVAT